MDVSTGASAFLEDTLRFLLHDSDRPPSTDSPSADPPTVFHFGHLPWETEQRQSPHTDTTAAGLLYQPVTIKVESSDEESSDAPPVAPRTRRTRLAHTCRPHTASATSTTLSATESQRASDSDDSLPSLEKLGIQRGSSGSLRGRRSRSLNKHSAPTVIATPTTSSSTGLRRRSSPRVLLPSSGRRGVGYESPEPEDVLTPQTTPCPSKRKVGLSEQIRRVRKYALPSPPPVRRHLFHNKNTRPNPALHAQRRQSPMVIIHKSKATTTVSSNVGIQFFSKTRSTWISNPSPSNKGAVRPPEPASTPPTSSRGTLQPSGTPTPQSSGHAEPASTAGLQSLPYDKSTRIFHKWSYKQKIVLCLLRRWYGNSWSELAAVFNLFFAGDLKFRGEEVHRSTAMATYWWDLRNGRKVDPAWNAVCIDTPFEDPRGRWLDLRTKLECAAQIEGVSLLLRNEDDAGESTPDKSRNKARPALIAGRSRNAAINEPAHSSSSDEDDEQAMWGSDTESPGPVRKKQAVPKPLPARLRASQTFPTTPQSASSPLMTTPGSSSYGPFGQDVMPKLFYRKFDNLSAGHNGSQRFIAGQFHHLSGVEAPPPMPTDSLWFPHMATNHLTRKPVATPFISVTGSFIWVLYQALKSEPSSEPSIALIHAAAAARDDGSWAYPVQPIMSGLKRTGFVKGISYKATQEWWVWAEVRQDAIVHVASLSELPEDLGIRGLLMLDELSAASSLTGFRNRLHANPRRLDVYLSAAIGRLVALLKLDPRRNEDFIAQLIHDITSGWLITFSEGADGDADFMPSSQDDIAQAFIDAYKISTDQDRAFWDGEEEALYRAFTNGLDLAAVTMDKERGYFERKASRKRPSSGGQKGKRSRLRRLGDDEESE